MKKILSILLLSMLALGACEDLSEMNINPNQPTETHPQLQLTNIQWSAFRANGGTSPLYANKMLVQTDGENSGQYYKWTRGDFDAYNTLRDISKMMEEAERIQNNSYIALAKFFRAFYFYNLTLTFGDIPYSQALQGEQDNLFAPAYDEQQAVFNGILQELEEANTLLEGENEIIAGDIIYNGDITKWRKLVNAYRLKVLLTLSEKEGSTDISIRNSFQQIVDNEPLFSSVDDNAQLVFLDQEGNRYPEFNSSGFGSGMYMDSTFIRRLQDHQDPRLFVYSTQTKLAKEEGKNIDDFSAYEGGDPAAPYADVNLKAAAGKVSKVNERYYTDPTTEPRVLLGYSEQQLILAEAVLRGWINGDAESYYKEGVRASFKFYEMYATGYEVYLSESAAEDYLALDKNRLSAVNSTEEKIERIVMQKYFQSFFQRGWTPFYEHLRTGYPEFRRPNGVDIPYRWIYPQSEYNQNSENVSAAIQRQFGEGNDKINQMLWWQK